MSIVPRPRRARAALAIAVLLAAAGCATGRDDVGVTPGTDGGGDGAEVDSGLGGVWGGALDTVYAPPAGGQLVLTTYYDDALLFFDAARGRPIARVLVGVDPYDVAPGPDRQTLFVSNTRGEASDLGSVSVVSLAGRHEGIRLDPHPYGRIAGLVAARDGVHLYAAATFGTSVLEYNLVSRRIDRAFRMPGTPYQLALDLTETTLYATDRNSTFLYALDLTSGNVRSVNVGYGPEDVVFSPDGFTLWVPCRGAGTVAIVDPGTLSVRQSLVAGREPVRVAFTPDGNRALVVNYGESSVAVFDARGLVRLAGVPVVAAPVAIAVSGDGRHAWVGSEREDRLSVIDLEGNIEVARIPVGQPVVSLLWVPPP
jgi:YVTN family beta-propeller protein